jgi:long-chain acyl-CoA synthetase
VLGITTYEGYGTTECAPLIAANHRLGRKTGTVGRPLIEAKLVDSRGAEIGYGDPATGEYRDSGGAAGELWVHGPNVMRGYLGDPEETARVLVEDQAGKIWYRTGDLFSLDAEGFLTFQGRVGRQFKLKNGEFVNPELLERIFSRVTLVEHVVVYGDPSRDFPLPLATVNQEETRKLAALEGPPAADRAALAERVRELFLEEADEAGLPAHSRPQRILLLPEPFSEENGTLTKGLKKIVPGAVFDRYRAQIASAYAE